MVGYNPRSYDIRTLGMGTFGVIRRRHWIHCLQPIVAVVCDAVAIVDREAQAEKHPELFTDKQNLEEAQERIWELTETVEILMMRQERLLSVADMLAKEVRAAVASPHSTGD